MFKLVQRLSGTRARCWLTGLCLVLLLIGRVYSQDVANFVVVGHALADGMVLRSDELRDLLLGRTRTLPDGHKVSLVLMDDGPANAELLQRLTGKSAMQFKRHWRQLVFSGKGVMPRFVDSESELLEFVRTEVGALGAVGSQVIHGGGVCVIPVEIKGAR